MRPDRDASGYDDAALLSDWATWTVDVKHLKQRTAIDRRQKIERVLAATGETLRTLTEDDIEQWIMTSDYAPRSVTAYLSALSTFYEWAVRKGHCHSDPTADVPRPRHHKGLPRPVPVHVMDYVLENSEHEMLVWLTLMRYAGLRCMEVAGLRWENIDGGVMRIGGKGDKERMMPMHAKVVAAIGDLQQRPAGFMFRQPTGRPWPASSVSRAINHHLAALDVPFSAHQWRHAFATEHYRGCGDIYKTSAAMGHDSVRTTEIYARLNPTDLAESILSMQ